jgi:hypothetical protein
MFENMPATIIAEDSEEIKELLDQFIIRLC